MTTERVLFVIATGLVLISLSASITAKIIDRARDESIDVFQVK